MILFFYPDYIIGTYKKDPIRMNRSVLHSTLHCLFGHLQIPKDYEEDYWNLACDIVVESMIDGFQKTSVRSRIVPFRRNTYQKLNEKLDVLTVKGVYRELMRWQLSMEEFAQLHLEFWLDDHCRWEKDVPPEKKMEREKIWKDLNEKLQTEMETFSKEAVENNETLLHQVQLENRERYDYRKFLKKFPTMRR